MTPTEEAPAPRPHAPLWLLALVTFSGTLAMHIFVPALPIAAKNLGAGMGAMQMTVSLYIFGLAVGQLLYGPMADRFGRRPVLLFGLGLYSAAGLVAALAPDVHALIAARLFQAIGGCAGLVLGRSIVRDTAGPQEATRRLALMNLMVTVGPSIAPLVGGALATALGWRSIFYALFALGIVGLLFTWRLLPETGTPGARLDASALARNYGQLLRSPAFLGFSIGGGCATTSMYAFIASAPFIFVDQLHRPAHEAGIYLAILVSGVWLGSFLTSHLIQRVRVDSLMIRSNMLSVLASFVLLGGVLSGHLSVPLVIGTMFLYTVGAGMASPTALTQAISVNPRVIGSASGLYGFTQMAVGALCTALAGMGHANPALAAALVLAVAGIVAQLSFGIALRTQKLEKQGA
ncbi:multidrug effflux MFS transporter [Variovorax sp. 770b2]|uniref:multidrug effflux MFS transporter n=1 Tax=Variovorax sp. 770b2 TaxID=1566271 RepID=UPI0008E584F6|nr:multidrug effflux MFS transporter [Variovorax sp. 770b2]SFQ24337.1 MFS transporter, DHA1 family, bicyclomycin/chloramphenicol resistance protein [Variovorax sp. 770b2]